MAVFGERELINITWMLGMLGVKAKVLRTYLQDLTGGDGMA